MAEDVYVKEVRSNVDALSADRLHQALFHMVSESVEEAGVFLRFVAPTRSGALQEHLGIERANELADRIRARLVVPEIHDQDDRPTYGRFRHAIYPLFVEHGTSTPITPAVRSAMWNKPEGIFGRTSVRGQKPQMFMAKTYAEAIALVQTDPSISNALRDMQAEAAALLPEIER